jgi:hypothetical protein
MVSVLVACVLALGGWVGTAAPVSVPADLERWAGFPGDAIPFTGADWLTCCPANTPMARVTVFLVGQGKSRWRMGVATPDTTGVITGIARVPKVPPGRYAVEACGKWPKGPGFATGDDVCFPVPHDAFRFRVKEGPRR